MGNKTYWQIIESKRVNGKPRPFVLMHLGTAEQLLYKLQAGALKKKICSKEHGSVELLHKAAQELDVLSLFEQTFSTQQRDGLTVGKSLFVAAIHRAVCPGSKRSFARWAARTSLPELCRLTPKKLDSQHFWEQMDAVTDQELAEAEKRVTLKLIEKGLFSPRLLFYDMTNFFTYIDSSNERNKLARRGRNKQKRHDLRQFGLSQVVTKDFLLPVFSEIYEGNQTDKKRFLPFLTRFREKMTELNVELEEVTLVFDKGSNSKKNFAELDAKRLSYVACLSSSYHQELLQIPFSSYQEVMVHDRKVFCYRTCRKVWGKDRTIVMYLSEKLRNGQTRGLQQILAKKYTLLRELKHKLNNPRARKKTKEAVQNKVQEILKGERTEQLINVSVQEREEGRFDIDWELDKEAYLHISQNIYGKKILVSSRSEWSDEEIIAAYHGQNNVERVFKQLKNPYHNAVHPQYHWTDQKIRVHTFICVIGLLLSQLLWKKAKEAGYNYSIQTLLDRLSEIRKAQIITLTGLKGKPVKETQLEEMEPELKKLYEDLLRAL